MNIEQRIVNMSVGRAVAWGVALGLAILLVVATATATLATPPNPDHKVTLCHRTGSATNPYHLVTVDIASSGYVKAGHDDHEQVGNGLGGDIIPAYTYTSKAGVVFNYPGKNLSTIIGGQVGADILAAGCVITTDESPTPTPTETPTVSPSETVSPSVEPSVEPSEEPTDTPTKGTVVPRDCLGNDKPARCFSQGPTPNDDLAFTGMSAGWAIGLVALFGGCGGLALWIARRKAAGL